MTANTNLQSSGPATGTREFLGWTLWLGEEIAADRISDVDHHLDALARAARRQQLVPASCDVLTDPTQPEVARARAFAKVVSALTEVRPASDGQPLAA